VKLIFQVSQHARDEQLIQELTEYFGCGFIVKYKDAFHYRIERFSDIEKKIIPFFNLNPVKGVKLLDYLD
jgi:hypothetical protein